MRAAQPPQVLDMVDESPCPPAVSVSLGTLRREGPEVSYKILVSGGSLLYFLPQRRREREIGESSEQDRIVRTTNDTQRCDYPPHDLVVCKGLPSRHPARHAGTNEPLLEIAPHPAISI